MSRLLHKGPVHPRSHVVTLCAEGLLPDTKVGSLTLAPFRGAERRMQVPLAAKDHEKHALVVLQVAQQLLVVAVAKVFKWAVSYRMPLTMEHAEELTSKRESDALSTSKVP